MPQEIERKFLANEGYKQFANTYTRITQGYLSSVPERIVRIRIRDERGYITIKGVSNLSGLSRYEWEKEIDVNDARELLVLCEPGIIDKTRLNSGNASHSQQRPSKPSTAPASRPGLATCTGHSEQVEEEQPSPSSVHSQNSTRGSSANAAHATHSRLLRGILVDVVTSRRMNE